MIRSTATGNVGEPGPGTGTSPSVGALPSRDGTANDLPIEVAPPPKPSRRFEVLVVTGVLLALLMGALDNFVVVTVLQTNILPDFGAPNGGTFVISAYIISSTVAVPIFGKLSDLWSRRNVFIAGLLVFIGGSALSGLSQNLTELIAFRAVQGFGAGDFFPVGLAIVAVTFPPEARARVTGLLSGVFGIATVAGPLIGSAIVSYTTWRWVFYVNLPVGLVGLAVIALTLGPLRPEVKRPFDLPGAALLVAWVGALMYPLIQVQDLLWAWGDPRTIGLLATSAVLAVVFVFWELRAREPLVPLRLLAHRVVAASGGTVFLIGMVFFSLITLLSFAVGGVLSHGASNSADVVRDVLYALVLPVVFGAVLGGQLLTRLPFRTVVLLGLAISFVGLFFLTRLTASTPTWTFAFGFLPVGGLILPLIPLGFGVGLTFPVFLLATQNQVPKRDVGEASGLIQFLQSLGGSVGLSMLATFQNSRFLLLDPSPSPSCTTTTPQLPLCAPFLQSYGSSQISAFDQTFWVMFALLVVALCFAVFLVGRMPKGEGAKPAAPGLG
jgi:EmrB/QacA subfamily drug resistance transporter